MQYKAYLSAFEWTFMALRVLSDFCIQNAVSRTLQSMKLPNMHSEGKVLSYLSLYYSHTQGPHASTVAKGQTGLLT